MSEKPTKSLVDKLPNGLKKNLSPGEEIVCYLKSFVIAERTNYEHPPHLFRRKIFGSIRLQIFTLAEGTSSKCNKRRKCVRRNIRRGIQG